MVSEKDCKTRKEVLEVTPCVGGTLTHEQALRWGNTLLHQQGEDSGLCAQKNKNIRPLLAAIQEK